MHESPCNMQQDEAVDAVDAVDVQLRGQIQAGCIGCSIIHAACPPRSPELSSSAAGLALAR